MSIKQHFSAKQAQNTLNTIPIGTVEIGEIFTVECRNGFGKSFSDTAAFESFMNSPEKTINNHPCTGPIAIKGIDETNSIAIKIIKIEPQNTFSCLSKSTGLLKEKYMGRSPTIYPNEKGYLRLDKEIFVSSAPSIGFIATITDTPLKGGRANANGGNLDMPYLKEGTTIYLPVNYKQALLGIGDVHFAQGLGEISGMALESDATVTLQVLKTKKFNYPIIETPDEIVIIGTGINEASARGQTLVNTLDYLKQQSSLCHISEEKIYQLLGGIGHLITGNLCGKTPTVGIAINKEALVDSYGLSQIQPPQIIYDNDITYLTELFKTALLDYETLSIIHDGDSRQIRQIPNTKYAIMRFNPVIYSFVAHGPIAAPNTAEYRVAINQFISDYLRENGVESSTLLSQGQYALVTVENATTHIEVVIKEAFAGSPKHVYTNLPQETTRFGTTIPVNGKHKPYVRFDWRLPHPADDTIMPTGLANYFIDTKTAEKTALKTFQLVKKRLNQSDLDIIDMCLFMNKSGNTILAEISPDNMGSLRYIGSNTTYAAIFANRDKSNTINKWQLATDLLYGRIND